jgi:hypothetical protein
MSTKTRIQDVAIVVVAWIAALILLASVVLKFKFLSHH